MARRIDLRAAYELSVMRWRVLLIVALLAPASCGQTSSSTADSGAQGGAGSSGSGGTAGAAASDAGGTAGTGGQGAITCEDTLPIRGVRFDAAKKCLDTTDVTEVGCNGEPFKGGYSCVRRLSDQAEYWVTHGSALVVDESVWERCPSASLPPPPPPCFAAACDQAPRTLCTLDDTIREFRCGARDSEWDANCCRRRDCSTTACDPGQECILVPTLAGWDCWPTGGDPACDCGGTTGGISKMLCVETTN